MATYDLSFSGVSIPTNASASVTLYEDVGADGSGSSTDPNGKEYDNSDTLSLSDGTTSYSTGDVFDGSSGNAVWVEFTADHTDVVATAEITVPLTISTSVTAGSVIVMTSNHTLQTNSGVIVTQ